MARMDDRERGSSSVHKQDGSLQIVQIGIPRKKHLRGEKRINTEPISDPPADSIQETKKPKINKRHGIQRNLER